MTDKTKEAPARSALKLALEALEKLADTADGFNVSGVYFNEQLWEKKCLSDSYDAIATLREALMSVPDGAQSRSDDEHPAIKQDLTPEQPAQQEPVAYIEHHKAGDNLVWDNPGGKHTPLYTSPPAQRKIPQNCGTGYCSCIECLKEPAAQQEPFGHVTVRRLSQRFENHADQYWFFPAGQSPYRDNVDEIHAVYTSPPIEATPLASQRSVKPWVGLTDDELSDVYDCTDWDAISGWEYERAIEAKLKEKNSD